RPGLPRNLPRPAWSRLDGGRESPRRTSDPPPRLDRPALDPRHRSGASGLARHGSHYCDAADLRPPTARPYGRAAVRAARLHDVQPEAAAGLPAPARVHLAPHRCFPARNLLREVCRPIDARDSRRRLPRSDAPTRGRRRRATAVPRHGLGGSGSHHARGLPPSATHGADPDGVRSPGPAMDRECAEQDLPQPGAVRRSRRVRLRGGCGPLHHRRCAGGGHRPCAAMVRTSRAL
ncbi:MAG: hypothetical protein AVDCRST_MAG60-2365, partial [uncultured Nocardioides sp.]